MDAVKTWAKRAALVVFVADMVHVYSYITKYYENDQDDTMYDDERVLEDEKIIQLYSGDCPPENLVTSADLEKSVKEVMNQLERDQVNGGLFDLDDPQLDVQRESVLFSGGGRAVYEQIAHPFIALGIRQHSMLERGVSRRFYNTFKYMFGMYFGTPEEITKSAKAVHGLHSKVVGKIGEDVGVFRTTSNFSAAEKNAIKYVSATLLETGIFAYELHVRLLSEAEKDHMVEYSSRINLLFGVHPTHDDPKTWKEFRRHMSAMWRSRVLTASESAKDTAEFLFLSPAPVYTPLLELVRYSSWVQLPPRLAKQFGGRAPNTVDYLLFSFFHAVIRFIYRLTPGSWRFLTAYWRMYDRVRSDRSSFSKMISTASANFTNGLLAMAMPPRDAEESVRKVREKRKRDAIKFEKVSNSPIKV